MKAVFPQECYKNSSRGNTKREKNINRKSEGDEVADAEVEVK
jgi:hypothetical protein